MPLYEYQCEDCGVRFERLQRAGEQKLKICPECGGVLYRPIQSPGIIFKGSGFYVTDNRRSNVGTRRSDTKSEGETSATQDDSSGKKDKPESSSD
jgi:putative FmdB family regulatory protein